jgi:hypothetical protein
MSLAAALSPSAYWYLTRGTGTVALILLTVSVTLGIADVRRVRTARIPRFVLDAVHRNASMLAVVFLVIHIITTLLDGFAPITLIDVVIPFTSAYRPLWLGLGAVASDLMLAVLITSFMRQRLGYRAWRAIHWAAYLSFPVAVLHGLGTGSDVKTAWLLIITVVCLLVVIGAVVVRVTDGWPSDRRTRLGALGACVVVPIGLLVWLPGGPLGADWAKRAGTPANLLPKTRAAVTKAQAVSAAAPAAFTASVSGSVNQSQEPNGFEQVDIPLTVAGQQLSTLNVRIAGQPLGAGGIQMTSSRVTLGGRSDPNQYEGRLTSLQGTSMRAALSSGSGARLTLALELQVAPGGGSASGTVSVSP